MEEQMNQEWEKLGKDIRNIVEDAVNSQNFSQLNKTISNTVNEAVNSIQKRLRTAGDAVNQAAERQKNNQSSNFGNWTGKKIEKNLQKQNSVIPVDKKRLDLFQKNTSIKAGGLALTICGCILNVGLGIAVVVLCLVCLFLGVFPLGIKIALSILFPLLIGSAMMTWQGSSMLSALKRYHNYIAGLRGRTYCNIKDLADQSGKSISFVVKDVRKMIEKGWFRQGHFNQEKTCLIVSHETYNEYEVLQRQRLEQQRQEQIQNQQNNIRAQEYRGDQRLQKVIEEGQQYIQRIRFCSGKISGQEISKKISHMEMLIQKIFDRVSQDPNSLDDITRLLEYYLPTTVKLLEAYQQLDSQPVQGENIYSSKIEIEQTLDTLNDAFERLLDSLFEEVAWDVSSDISVLHTMLAQEGLVGNEFERSKT